MHKYLPFLIILFTPLFNIKAQSLSDSVASVQIYHQGVTKLYTNKDVEGAIKEFDKSIELYPTNVEAYVHRRVAKIKLKDYLGALRDDNKIVELHPLYRYSYSDRAETKELLGDYRGAIQDLSKAIEVGPICGDFAARANAYSELKNYSASLKDYDEAIRRASTVDQFCNLSYYYYRRGFIKYYLNNKEGACLDWSKAGELGQDQSYELIQKYCN